MSDEFIALSPSGQKNLTSLLRSDKIYDIGVVSMNGQTERSSKVYSVSLPPEMILCTNVIGAARLMNRHRVSISAYIKDGRLRSFNMSGNSAVPLEDIAKLLNTTEMALYNIAIAYKILLWQVYRK